MKRHVRKRKAAVFVCVLGICLLTSACVAQQEAGTKEADSFSALPPAERPAVEEPASAELPADQRLSDGKLEWREDGSVALTLWTARAVFPHPVNFAFFLPPVPDGLPEAPSGAKAYAYRISEGEYTTDKLWLSVFVSHGTQMDDYKSAAGVQTELPTQDGGYLFYKKEEADGRVLLTFRGPSGAANLHADYSAEIYPEQGLLIFEIARSIICVSG